MSRSACCRALATRPRARRATLAALAAWLLASASPAAEAPAPAAAPPPPLELLVFEAMQVLRDNPDLRRLKDAERTAKARELWDDQPPADRALFARRVAYAQSRFAEGSAMPLDSARGRAFLFSGPPSRIHVEAARAWAGDVVPRLDAPEDEMRELFRGASAVRATVEGKPLPPAGAPKATITLSGALPSEAWVYSTPSPATLRVLWFVDEDRDGKYRLVRDALVSSSETVSEAPAEELPADLHAQVTMGGQIAALPELKKDVLRPAVTPYFFKAHEAKTYSRFAVAIRHADLEIDLEVVPAQWLPTATVWFQVEQDAAAVFQTSVKAGEPPLPVVAGSSLAEVGVPLLPGAYTYTVAVVDGEGVGGRVTGSVTVPSLQGALGLSTPVVAKAGADGALPVAPPPGSAGELHPFQVGKYLALPESDFKVGETVAVVLQIYNAPAVFLEYEVYVNDVSGGALPPIEASEQNTEIQLFELVEGWPPGSYKVVVTATDARNKARTARQEATFRVRG
jgi:hypothetical protein